MTTTTTGQHFPVTALHFPVTMTTSGQHFPVTAQQFPVTTTTSDQHFSVTAQQFPVTITTTSSQYFSATMTAPFQHLLLAPTVSSTSSCFTPSISFSKEQSSTVEHVLTICWLLIKPLSAQQQQAVLSTLFDMFLQSSTTLSRVPNFIEYSVKGMYHLADCARSNVIYSLAKSLGTLRPDNSDSLLPAKRMPMGLIEYCVNFFNASSIQEVWLNLNTVFNFLPSAL